MLRGRAIAVARSSLARAGARERGVATSANVKAGMGPAVEPTTAPTAEVRDDDATDDGATTTTRCDDALDARARRTGRARERRPGRDGDDRVALPRANANANATNAD